MKKVLEVLASNEKGRKFLLYTVGITLFIVMLPLIVLFGMFAWMGGGSGPAVAPDQIIGALPSGAQQQVSNIQEIQTKLPETFYSNNLTDADIKKAEALFYGYLLTMEYHEGLCQELADCFVNISDSVSVYDNIQETFGITITEDERIMFDNEYGVTALPATDG